MKKAVEWLVEKCLSVVFAATKGLNVQRRRGRGFESVDLLAKIVFAILVLSGHALAMDRWTALAMVESGGDDRIIGQAGEISRYQIRPELWPGGNPIDTHIALANAQRIMSARIRAFEQSHGRAPDDFEFYVLWNAPAQIDRPSPIVAGRARRFMNLVVSSGPNIST